MEREQKPQSAAASDLSRRAYLRGVGLAALGAGAAAVLSRAGASGGPDAAAIESLLLVPEDIPEAGVRGVRRLGLRRTRDGGLAAQAILETAQIRIFHGLVAFPSERAARAALRGIRKAQAMRGRQAAEQPSFGEESVALAAWRGGGRSIAVVFREGGLLARLTLVGAAGPAELVRYARKAEAKARAAMG